MPLMGNDYVVLSLDGTEERQRTRNRSFKRTWNSLSRLQRSLIYFLFAVLLLIGFYAWLNTYKNRALQLNKLKHEVDSKIKPVEDEILAKLVDSKLKPVENDVVAKHVLVPEIVQKDFKKEKIVATSADLGDTGKIFVGPTNERQKAVVSAFKHAWAGYKSFAWGHDMLKPMTRTYHDWFGLGLTLVDALDTMYIMNLKEEFKDARNWVENSLNMDVNREVNLFEVTIRVLGGLLSTHHLSGDQMFLEKARELGIRLLPCFDTSSGVPFSDVNLASLKAHSPKWSPDSSTSEVTTIQLEMRALSRMTGDERFEKVSSRVSEHVHNLPKTSGLVPIFINSHTGQFRAYSTITLGARGDSYYEYLLKQWIQTGKTIDYLRDDYEEAIKGVKGLLMRRTPKQKLLYVGELVTGGKDFKPKMDHLTCYLPGTLALGVLHGMPEEHMQLAQDLAYTCYQTYAMHPTFLAPEISYFSLNENANNDIYVMSNDAHNLLRPELLESLWVLYQITGNTTYQDWGWNIFQGFEKYTKVTNGYTSIGSVTSVVNTKPKDMMESFFLGETLKYLYLLFSDTHEISLNEYVVNSEAHPLPIYQS